MQRGNYEKKKEAMRAYSKTPAGREAKQRSHDNQKIKRGLFVIRELKINPQALLKAIANWR